MLQVSSNLLSGVHEYQMQDGPKSIGDLFSYLELIIEFGGNLCHKCFKKESNATTIGCCRHKDLLYDIIYPTSCILLPDSEINPVLTGAEVNLIFE